MEKEKFSFLDVLSGKAAVAAEKKASPNLFRTNNSQQSKTNKKQKINENAKTAITYFQVQR